MELRPCSESLHGEYVHVTDHTVEQQKCIGASKICVKFAPFCLRLKTETAFSSGVLFECKDRLKVLLSSVESLCLLGVMSTTPHFSVEGRALFNAHFRP